MDEGGQRWLLLLVSPWYLLGGGSGTEITAFGKQLNLNVIWLLWFACLYVGFFFPLKIS